MHATIPFHLAFPVHDLEKAREFYGGLLQCPEGRSDTNWIDFNLFGHQIVAHFSESAGERLMSADAVDQHHVPVPHFGAVLPWNEWETLAERLKAANVEFVIEPCVRFAGQTGEQATMFFLDPSGNALEFKALRNIDELFRKQDAVN